MALQAAQIADLIATTIRDLGRNKFTEIATDIQRFIAMSKLMTKNKITFSSGYEFQFDLMTDDNGSAAYNGLYAQDNVNVSNVMTQASVPFRHITWNWAIERRELKMNREPARIVELIKTRRIAAMISAVKKFENRFWRVPASTDDVNPFGIPYWIVKNNSEGFNGTTPSGYTTVAGLSTTTVPRWKNYTAQYTAVSKEDLIRKWRKAATFTDFEPPVEGIPDFNTGNTYGFYTNYGVVGPMEELLEAQNENLGNDVASMDGKVLFRRTGVTWVPQLEEDTTNPIYGINWGVFKVPVLADEWMLETPIPIQPGQHTVSATHVDCSHNYCCYDRRRQLVLATNTGLPV